MAALKFLFTLLVLVAALVAWIALPWQGALVLLLLLAAWLGLTRSGVQARSVAGIGLRTLPQRLGSSAVIVMGIAGVVGVLVALLAMAEGYGHTVRQSGSEDSAIVLRGGSAAEVQSVLTRDSLTQIAQAQGIARSAKGEPLVSEEIVVAANLPIKGRTQDDGSVQMRGIGEMAYQVRPHVRIVQGRHFQPGLTELVVGQGAARQFAGLTLGSTLRMGNREWTVVGVFASGDAMESEVWADAEIVASTYRRGSSRNSVTLKLERPESFSTFKQALAANPQLKVDASTTLDFYAKQSERMTQMLRIIGITVGSIMAVGAVFGALNTMFAAVASRAREIATLRAIGFGGTPVVTAVLIETMLLALLGGAIGGALSYVLFNGFEASTLSAGSVGKLSFELRVSADLLWQGLKWALAIGMIGGLFPALRAATLPVSTALREA
ncbi:ABC transporter permease [Roseateles sp. BYS180W]|uniref:ABC transporter permease n=1 Tax=Roseateles rivi TaxID=3299028 RepID=A0ABW7FV71_9BURK